MRPYELEDYDAKTLKSMSVVSQPPIAMGKVHRVVFVRSIFFACLMFDDICLCAYVFIYVYVYMHEYLYLLLVCLCVCVC